MKRTIQTLGMFVASGIASLSASAFDFEADGLCFNIIPGAENKAEVTFRASGKGNAGYASGTVTIPAAVEHDSKTYEVAAIGKNAFQACAELTAVEIPESVTEIGGSAFRDCKLLTTVNLPASLDKISESLFFNCLALTSIDIPTTVTVIGTYAFENCKSLTNMLIPDSVITIEGCAFELCTGLESATIGASVETIGEYAFSGCSGLKSVSISASVASIDESSFNGCNGLQEFVVAAGNPSYSSSGGLLYNKDADTLLICPKGIKGNVEIPGSVTTISDKAFSSCNDIDAIYCLSSTPATVGDSTFDRYQYTHVSLYVPKGSIEAYKNAETWSKFSVMEEFSPNVGVESVDDSSAKTELGRYDPWGARADKGHKGVVVVVYSDGTRAKRYSNGF